MNIGAALADAQARGIDRLDAQWLLCHVLGQGRSWLLAHDDLDLAPPQAEQFDELLRRRAAGEPFAYLVGEAGFHGLALQVGPAVLVPRPDTELLVDWAIELLAGLAAPRVIDLGTGSGAIALAVKKACPSASVLATDLSPAALAQAGANAERLGLAVDFRLGAWWEAAGSARFDLVLSNPPYIAAGDPHLPALRHEPALALSPGGDGLDAVRQIAAGAPRYLRPGAWLLLEHGHDQAEAVQALLQGHGLGDVSTRLDLGGRARCTGGRMP